MMHSDISTRVIETEAKPLATALAFFNARIIQRRNTVPILSCVALGISSTGGLSLYGNNLDVAASLELTATWSGEPFAVAVDSAALGAAVKKCDGSRTLEIRLVDDGDALELISGRTRMKVRTMPLDDLPNLSEPAADAPAFTVPAAQFNRDLKAVAPAMSKEESRYYLKGVAIQARDGDIVTVATDGKALASVRRPLSVETIADSIIPDWAVAALLKHLALAKSTGDVTVRLGADRGAFEFDGGSITFKLIDGTFPDWQLAIEKALGSELQTIADPELCPSLPVDLMAKLEKGIGGTLSVATGEQAAALTCEAFPEFFGLAMLSHEPRKGFSYRQGEGEEARVRDYATGLAERIGLPAPADGGRMIHKDGFATGYTFGTVEWLPAEYVTRLDYTTFTEREIKVAGGETWADGSYSILFARDERQCVADVSIINADGSETPIATNDAGAIELTAKAVASLVGPVEEMERVEMPRLAFLHGRIIARDGIATDGSGRRFLGLGEARIAVSATRGRVKWRSMTDREALDAYNRDSVGFMESMQPQWLDPADESPAVEMEGSPVENEPDPIELETPQDAPEAVEPVAGPEPVAEALSERLSEPSDEMEAAGGIIGELIAELSARVASLEAQAAAKPEPESDEAQAPAMPVARQESSAARLRIIRRYLAMRAERAELRARLAKSEARAERLEFDSAENAIRTASAELRADQADAKWQETVDRQQAKIVRLENEKIERMSGGLIKMSDPVRVQVKPTINAFKDIGGGCHALVLSPGAE